MTIMVTTATMVRRLARLVAVAVRTVKEKVHLEELEQPKTRSTIQHWLLRLQLRWLIKRGKEMKNYQTTALSRSRPSPNKSQRK